MYCQKHFIKITSATITDGNLVLNTDLTNKTYQNGQRIVFCICSALPASATIVPVVFGINGTTVPMLDINGNTLQSDQITSCHPYAAVWGTLDDGHIKLCSCTKRSQAAPAEITPEVGGGA